MKKSLLFIFLFWMFIFSVNQLKAQQQFDNSGFEDWEEIGFGPNIIEPVNWSSIKSTDDSDLNGTAPVVWERSEDAHSGNYSLYLKTLGFLGIIVPGTITNGRIHSSLIPDSGYTYTDPGDAKWHTSISKKPDSLVGWYKVNPTPGDFAKVKVVVHRGRVEVSENKDTTDFIGSGTLFLPGEPVETWTRFSMPIHYYKTDVPEFILLTISSSVGLEGLAGSELWVDDLHLVYNSSGIAEENAKNIRVYASGNRLHVLINSAQTKNYSLKLYDLTGKLCMQQSGQTNENSQFNYQLPRGIYVVSVSYDGKLLTKKVVL